MGAQVNDGSGIERENGGNNNSLLLTMKCVVNVEQLQMALH